MSLSLDSVLKYRALYNYLLVHGNRYYSLDMMMMMVVMAMFKKNPDRYYTNRVYKTKISSFPIQEEMRHFFLIFFLRPTTISPALLIRSLEERNHD